MTYGIHVQATKPQNPIVGDVYFDQVSSQLLVWDSKQWIPFAVNSQLDYVLMLDDERDFDDIDYKRFGIPTRTHLATTVEHAKRDVMQYGLPKVIFFDHDLGKDQPDATKFMWWLIDQHLDEQLDLRKLECVVVHSANPVGADRLVKLWEGFRDTEGIMAPVHRIWPGVFE